MNTDYSTDSIDKSALAIIGMSGRFPGAKNIDEFWQNLKSGVESTCSFSEEELLSEGIDLVLVNDPHYVKIGSMLSDISGFDAAFFGFSAREAELTDPQQRIFLECAWEVLENAGYNPEISDSAIGVYAGAGMNVYLLNNVHPNYNSSGRYLIDSALGTQIMIGNYEDYLPTRVSYKLNLKGPSVNVQTACSTSLVAVHIACQNLLNGECDMALAGGISLLLPHKAGYMYQQGMIVSPDGHCRAFDAKAQGTFFGDGVGVLLLKRLQDAIADGDYIHAIIKGSAINNDGNLKVSYTAPSVEGQAEVIAEAHAVAGINAETISYIEAHGTGTAIGDPIEIAALSKAFGASTHKKGFCAIGSVKTNVGHLGAAAGIAGLIKTVLALKHQLIPASLHFEKPNPQIDFANSPFYVNSQLSEWKRNGTPRRAGVSSFGFGGTNAHIILEEAPLETVKSKNVVAQCPQLKLKSQLLLISAKTRSALDTATKNLAAHLKENPDLNLADVAYTLSIGRKAFNHRLAVVCSSVDEAVSTLTTLESKRVFINELQDIKKRPVIFMFSGQGSQYVNMGRELYENEPIFCEQVDLCCELLESHLGFDLRDVFYPNQEEEQDDYSLQETAITQPALFVIEYALAHLWMEWGILPVAAIGHSIGEYVAATIAGVFSLADALALVAARGKLMQSMPKGSMLAVPLTAPELQLLLDGRVPELSLEVALINSPADCVVSGTTEAIAELEKQLAVKGLECRRLHTSHAYHSQMMEPILAPFTELVEKVNLQAPKIPYISNLTGTWITAAEATNPSYWAQHLRQTVRFAEGVQQFCAKPDQILLEVGPGRTLSRLVKRHPDRRAEQIILTSLPHPQENQSDLSCLLSTLGQLWVAGVEVDWLRFYTHKQHYRLPLPTYPFERQRYWLEPPQQVKPKGKVQQIEKNLAPSSPSSQLNELVENNNKDTVKTPQLTLGKKPDIADWFYAPSWRRSPISFKPNEIEFGACTLVFIDDCGLGSQLVKALELKGHNKVVSVRVGSQFTRIEPRNYLFNPQQRDDYDALLKELIAENLLPKTILHLWSVAPKEQKNSELDWVETSQNRGFYSLLFLAQAIGKQQISDEIHIAVVTNNMQNVTDFDLLCPEQATVLGPCQIIPIEYSHISCSSIDIVLSELGTGSEQLRDQILLEIATKPSDSIIAYRDSDRWVQTFEPVKLKAREPEPDCASALLLASRFREKGVYLITGGLGGIGLTLAEYLAQTVRAKLILTTRSAFPSTDEWDQWLDTHDEQDATSSKIRKLQAMQSLGTEVAIAHADVANRQQMQTALALPSERWGQIHGIIHAAGVPGGGVIQWKTRAMAQRVLDSKVKGTLVLDTLFKDIQLDFFVNCSSITAILPLFGQVDYCAANAFLNAFAHYKTAKDGTFTVSINWDTWQEVGMAVAAAKQQTGDRSTQIPEIKKVTDSLFHKCIVEEDREIYVTNLSGSTHWLLDEHRVLGKPTLPGTAYLEMARSAFEAHANGGCIEIQDVYFLNPLVVGENEVKEVRTIINKQGSNFEFSIVSPDPADEGWQQHAIGKITSIEAESPEKFEVKQWENQCQEKILNPKNHEEIMEFGPRWDSLQQLNFGENQGFAYLELPAAFAADLKTYKLHPALLDTATSFMSLKHGGDYLPFSYKRLRIKAALPAKFYSYIKCEENHHSEGKTLKFNIAIADEQGRVIVEIEDLLIRSIERTELGSKNQNQSTAEPENFSLEIGSPGLLETLTFQPTTRQKPRPGEVEIEVSATGINFKEVLLALGMLSIQSDTPKQFGWECAGKIVSLGAGVEEFQIGDEVIAFGSSCYSQFTTTASKLVAPKPAHLSAEEAATIPVAFMTAYYALVKLARLSQREKVLIHAAAGGVGLAAVKIAQMLGAEIFVTAGKPEKRAFLHNLGIEHIMDSRSLAFADEVMKRTDGKGVDVVLNSLNGEFIPKSLALLAPYGRFLEIGKRDIYENSQLGLRPFDNNLSFFAITVEPNLPNFNSILREVVRYFQDGNLSPLPQQVFPITEVASAFDYMARAKHIGKVVVSLENKAAVKSLITEGGNALKGTGTVRSSQSFAANEHQQQSEVKNVILKHLNEGLLPTEGVDVFQRILASNLHQVIVSTRDLESVFQQNSVSALLGFLKESASEDLSQLAQPRRKFSNAYVAPRNQLEQTITEIWQQFFRVEQMGIENNFFDLGGDSLMAVQLISQVRKTTGVDISLDCLLDSPTVAGLASAISTLRQQKTTNAIVTNKAIDLKAEAVLDSSIHPETFPIEFITNPDAILLTGATGYIGTYLLDELLKQTSANIYCLVRSANLDEGKQRIQRKLESSGLWNGNYHGRILPVIGDLSAEHLGLDKQQFYTLANQIDVIYHNGAWVNFVYPYSMLKPANVLGTQEVLRLAFQNKVKPVHYISSYAIIATIYSQAKLVRESDPPIYNSRLERALGYGQSKWVAENLVTQARDRGLPVCIYRPGEIIGNQKTGIPNPNQMMWAIIKSCIQMGIAPELETIIDWTPVDYISRAIVHLSRQKESLKKVFNLVNPQIITWRELFNSICSLGYSLELIPPDKWRSHLIEHAENHPENALHPFLPMFAEKMAFGEYLPQLDCQNTLNGLVGTDIVCHGLETQLIQAYYSHLITG